MSTTDLIFNITFIRGVSSLRVAVVSNARFQDSFCWCNQLWQRHSDLKEGYLSVSMVTVYTFLYVIINS